MNKSFVFYDSFFDALEGLPAEIYAECINALCSYALRGEVPEDMSPSARMYFRLVKPQIDANNKRRENGRKGGESKANSSKGVAKPSKQVANDNVNVNENVNANVNVNQKKELTLQKKAAADSVSEAVDLWNSMNVSEIDEHVEVKKGSKRFRALSNLLAVHGIDKYREAIAKVKQSEFLRGHGERGWVIKFNWMIQPENFGNIISGAYDRCSVPNSKPVGNKFNNCMQREHGADYFTELEKAKLGSLGITPAIGAAV